MKDTSRNILIWIIILLSVSNLTIIGTIVYKVYFQSPKIESNQTNKIQVPNQRLGRFFRQELNLSFEQHRQFRSFRHKFHKQANGITFKMMQKRNEMLTELGKEQSDTVRLHQLAKEFGVLHEQLKHCTFEYYLNMKSVCNEQQKEKLFEIFKAMMNNEAEVKMPNKMKNNFQNQNN